MNKKPEKSNYLGPFKYEDKSKERSIYLSKEDDLVPNVAGHHKDEFTNSFYLAEDRWLISDWPD